MLLNCSNHPYETWSADQKKAAEVYGNVIDYNFPSVRADLCEKEIELLATETADKILNLKPDYVMCQGEFTLAFSVVEKIRAAGVEVIAACSERQVTDKMDENGYTIKCTQFKFVRFRNYA